MASHILVVDDDQSMCELIEEQLVASGYTVEWCLRADTAFELLRNKDFDGVIADINLDRASGVDLCKKINENWPDTPVILITAFGSMASAISAIRAGAVDFINKPVTKAALLQALDGALRHGRFREKVKRLETNLRGNPAPDGDVLLGESIAMKKVLELVQRVALSDTMVLIHGESGTGKEVIARILHGASQRAHMPFVALNCAAVAPHLIESELFGHVKGAFTDAKDTRAGLFEQAAGGTLLLDEVGEMPLDMQPKLLRVLQERQLRPVGGNTVVPITARIIAATNRDLERDVAARRFRADLYYRLNVVQIEVPPLRARDVDILPLARHFVARFAERNQKPVRGISPEASQILLRYDWPGNVRELENAIQRAVALSRSEQIEVSDLPDRIRTHQGATPGLTDAGNEPLLPLDEIERRHIQQALRTSKGNKTLAAKVLGVDRRTLYRRLERYAVAATGTTNS